MHASPTRSPSRSLQFTLALVTAGVVGGGVGFYNAMPPLYRAVAERNLAQGSLAEKTTWKDQRVMEGAILLDSCVDDAYRHPSPENGFGHKPVLGPCLDRMRAHGQETERQYREVEAQAHTTGVNLAIQIFISVASTLFGVILCVMAAWWGGLYTESQSKKNTMKNEGA